MTVCISAICEDGKALVSASDKMITAAPPYVEFEHDFIKVEELSSRCIALTAGSALRHTELCRKVKRCVAEEENPQISAIISTVQDQYDKLRKKKLEEIFFFPRGLTLQGFLGNMSSFPREFVFTLDKNITQFDYGITILLGGVDETGGHIYRIENPGVAECFDSIGFNAIGIGQDHAVLSLIGNQYTVRLSLNEAVYLIYEAKKKSRDCSGSRQRDRHFYY